MVGISRSKQTTKFVVALCATVATFSSSARADEIVDRDPNAFFKNDVVSTTFAPSIELAPKAELEFYDNTPWKLKEEEQQEVVAAAQPPSAVPSATESLIKRAPHLSPELKNLPTREKLLAAYGDPGTETPVLAQENAPTPFKGLMASLQEGDAELGFRYAKQYVRYIKNVQERVERVTSLQGLAMRSEGILTPENEGVWKNQPQYLEDRELYENDIAKTLEEDMKKNGLSLDGNPNARKLIQKAIEASSTRNIASLAPKKIDVAKLPADENGEAKVIFVIKLHGELADEAGEAIASFESALGSSNSKITSEVQVVDEEENDKLSQWAHAHNIKSQVTVVDQSLNLVTSRAPMTLVMAPSTRKFYVEPGIRSASTLIQAANFVQGDRDYGIR